MRVFLVWMRGRPVRLLLAAFVASLIAGVFCTTAGLAAPLATTAGSSGANVIVSPRPADCAADDSAQAQSISSEPMPCARMLVIARWAAISDQRRDVLDLSFGEVRRILRGDVFEWSELGGSWQPITVILPSTQGGAISEALGIPFDELAAEFVPDEVLTHRVATTPGAFALIEPERLTVGVLALTVDGHDPYQDPARQSPLRQLRWVRASTVEQAVELLTASGVEVAPPFDPAGMLVTGELIPVRCTNHVLAFLNDYDAMFDGVRGAILDAEIAVAPLELPLSDIGELTPCVETVVFTGSPRVLPALSNAGLDVILTIGNHMMDCWGGCDGVVALYDTLAGLDEMGIAHAGAGPGLKAARTPAVLSVDTADGPVTFAFLGYDIIAPWYAATEDRAGTAPLEPEYVRRDISAARRLADHVIVGTNWGVEYTSNPVAFQREIAGIAMEAGATFLFGNHPHWVQAVEHFGDQLVAYSFGNFIFDQNWSVATTQGMLMELGFTKDRLLGYRIRPVVIRAHSRDWPWLYRPEFVDPAGEGRAILDRIWNATDRLPARPEVAASIPTDTE